MNCIDKIKKWPWENILLITASVLLSLFVFYEIRTNPLIKFDKGATLTNLLTINGIFSAILITYLFTRITWSKDRKLELYNESISLSQKITEFRRILNKLTLYYNVWVDDDKYSKKLIDHGKFKSIEYYDYRKQMVSDYKPKDAKLIEEFYKHENYSEGISTLYLAMVSLVRNRKVEYDFPEELYKDFEHKGLYNFKVVERWIDCDIMSTIWYWLNKNRNWINYAALGNDKEYILAAAARINEKYKGHELNNKLLEELADDFGSHYLKELYLNLRSLKKGIQDLNLLIMVLISVSLLFGVLIPFILFLLNSNGYWYSTTVAAIASINAGLIVYFILKFPFLINRELKWA